MSQYSFLCYYILSKFLDVSFYCGIVCSLFTCSAFAYLLLVKHEILNEIMELTVFLCVSVNQMRVFKGHTNEKNFVGLSVNSEYIACGSETNEVFVYHKVG